MSKYFIAEEVINGLLVRSQYSINHRQLYKRSWHQPSSLDLHREDGPAVEYFNREGIIQLKEFYLNNQHIQSPIQPFLIRYHGLGMKEQQKTYIPNLGSVHKLYIEKDQIQRTFPIKDSNNFAVDNLRQGIPITDELVFSSEHHKSPKIVYQQEKNLPGRLIFVGLLGDQKISERRYKIEHNRAGKPHRMLHCTDDYAVTLYDVYGNIRSQQRFVNNKLAQLEDCPVAVWYSDQNALSVEYWVKPDGTEIEIGYNSTGVMEQKRCWFLNGDYMQCEYYPNGSIASERWFGSGCVTRTLHRTEGPALMEYDAYGNILRCGYYINGNLHSPDPNTPALETYWETGAVELQVWASLGLMHREGNLPARIQYDSSGNWTRKEYRLHDQCHRTDGPTLELADTTPIAHTV